MDGNYLAVQWLRLGPRVQTLVRKVGTPPQVAQSSKKKKKKEEEEESRKGPLICQWVLWDRCQCHSFKWEAQLSPDLRSKEIKF